MNCYRLFALLATLVASSGPMYAEASEQEIATTVKPGAIVSEVYSLDLKDATITEVISALRTKLSVPICYELEELDPKIQGVTARERLAYLRAKSIDKSAVANMEICANANPGSIVSWHIARHDVKLLNMTQMELVAKALVDYDTYEFKLDNAYLLIRPKVSVLTHFVGERNSSDTNLLGALKQLQPILQKRNITPMNFLMGPPKGMKDPFEARISRISLHGETLSEALTRLCQAAEPRMVWSLDGMKGSRILSFLPVSVLDPHP